MSDMTEPDLNDPIQFARLLSNRIGVPISTDDVPVVRERLSAMFNEAYSHGAMVAQQAEAVACLQVIEKIFEQAMKDGNDVSLLRKAHEEIVQRVIK